MPTQSLVPMEVMTVEEARAHLKVSRTWLYEQMNSGRLRYSRFGRMRRIPVSALNEFIANGGSNEAT